ncbi:hypothetical protein O1R50_09170 [Glycomyces luteolus]|uniref:Uncharacterized protein n=1 Tax=Glycomyces luteolus TaxID=2670330 RepID=A0A9X3PA42_9ACTN|nr:hypothetical protein [Glycomyces luteolus]MDA1359792.1 hypothetical protein [Glycomyces luteolus]
MSTICHFGDGVLRWPEADGHADPPGMVALHDAQTERRLILPRIPVGRTGVLVAAIAIGDLPEHLGEVDIHAKDAGFLSIVLASGTVRANQPAPGIGPADLIGCAPNGATWCWLDPDAIGLATDRHVRLEFHNGCTCTPEAAHSTPPKSVASMATNPTGTE